MKTRRQFLQAATAAAGVIAFPTVTLGWPASTSGESRYKRFAAAVNTPFEIELEGGKKVILILTEALLQQSGPDTESFLLRFQNTSAELLSQGTYPFENRHLGRSEIFIVPDGLASSRPACVAVFNSLRV